VSVGEYAGVVRVHRRTFQCILAQSPTPQRCIEAYYLNRTQLERIAERKLRRRQLSDDANGEITGRDLREREAAERALTARIRGGCSISPAERCEFVPIPPACAVAV